MECQERGMRYRARLRLKLMLISRFLRGTGDWESNEADSETFNACLDYHYYLQFHMIMIWISLSILGFFAVLLSEQQTDAGEAFAEWWENKLRSQREKGVGKSWNIVMGNNGYSALPYKLLYTILSPPCYLPPPTSNCLSPIGESQDPRVWYCTRCMMPDRKGDGPASIFSSPFFPLSILRFSAGGAAHRLCSVHRAQRCASIIHKVPRYGICTRFSL
ncbi:hypothetical protein L207DRAFT_167614 [Hyaloscypha variabilis F]|uniref:Uncharacterized protein n=1 Tax=Hyaloscypha variabilis (strain UAMH 11265 / GT02V1 / F) TaxID=1149755 RepID=A0A2J6R3V3_HYAVF|nr:hypothetical protein L207DRAFT_167614 [Hyaloscypha variabilis F]